jgi:hypothetical protein
MEIGPVAGIRVTPVPRVAPVVEGPSAVFDIERLASSADDAWTGDGRKAAGGQDDEDDELNIDNDPEPDRDLLQSQQATRVNFFA